VNQPLPAVHAAEQIATTAVLLASDAATMINRAKMLVDGGCAGLANRLAKCDASTWRTAAGRTCCSTQAPSAVLVGHPAVLESHN
jgi:hypothetical protein